MRSRRCKDYKNNFAHLLNIIYQHTCPSCFMLFLAERSLLCFPWQRDIFYAEECGAEHEQLCCKNQHRTVDNSLWRYRHANSSEENCCRKRCYRQILFHRHSFFKTITITITITITGTGLTSGSFRLRIIPMMLMTETVNGRRDQSPVSSSLSSGL